MIFLFLLDKILLFANIISNKVFMVKYFTTILDSKTTVFLTAGICCGMLGYKHG